MYSQLSIILCCISTYLVTCIVCVCHGFSFQLTMGRFSYIILVRNVKLVLDRWVVPKAQKATASCPGFESLHYLALTYALFINAIVLQLIYNFRSITPQILCYNVQFRGILSDYFQTYCNAPKVSKGFPNISTFLHCRINAVWMRDTRCLLNTYLPMSHNVFI